MSDADVNDVEMGPGMDLVVSLLAFVILVLAILALEQKVGNANSEANARLPTAIEKPDPEGANLQEIERLTRILATTNRELEQARNKFIGAGNELKRVEILLGEKDKQLIEALDELVEKDKANAFLAENLTHSQGSVEALEEKLGTQSEAAATTVAKLDKEKTDELTRLGSELNKALALLAETNRKSDGQTSQLDEFISQLTEVEDEKAQLVGQLTKEREENEQLSETAGAKVDSLNQQVQTLQGLLDEARAQLIENRRRIPVELSDKGDLEIFEQGKATLTAAGRARLYQLLPKISLALTQGEPNVIRVAGHASPERMARGVRQGFDNNLQLSAERSLTIAYELASLGVPLRCITTEGHGRSRSPTLGRINGNLSLEGFDVEFEKQTEDFRRQFLQSVAGERRVEVLVTRESEGQCWHSLLKAGVLQAGTEARSRLSNR